MGKSTISMAIFNSYVSLPEGKIMKQHHMCSCLFFFKINSHVGGFVLMKFIYPISNGYHMVFNYDN